MKKKRERASLTEKEERVLSLTLSSSSLHSVQVCNDDLTLSQRCPVSLHALYNGGNNLVDRISYLPDDLLCHILSFLPTKLAFTTTVLSKRWIPLCYSLPVLRFDHENEESYSAYHKFCRIVDTIMLSPRYSTNKPLKMFHLMCPYRHNDQNSPFNVTKWLEAAKQRSVEEFHLTLNYQKLKPIILVSQTLVILKLKKIEIDSDTSCVDLPSLKILNLEYIFFRNDNDYMNFLYGCPNLESLHLETIKMDSYMKHDENNVPEEGLKSLTLSKLVRANIDSMDVLFNGIDNVEFLRITKGLGSEEFSFKAIPLFSNLIHIELLFWNHSLHCWDGVVELLHHSPKLQILYIKKWKKTSSSMEWKCPISVLECVSSHLRSCTILNFHGSANDLRFAKYILQNASLLQNMTVDVTIGSSNGLSLEKGQIMEELSSYPRISQECKLSF